RHLESSDDPTPEPRQEMEVRELVTVRKFRDLPEALLAKGSLESAGIECFLADENLVRLGLVHLELYRWDQVERQSCGCGERTRDPGRTHSRRSLRPRRRALRTAS